MNRFALAACASLLAVGVPTGAAFSQIVSQAWARRYPASPPPSLADAGVAAVAWLDPISSNYFVFVAAQERISSTQSVYRILKYRSCPLGGCASGADGDLVATARYPADGAPVIGLFTPTAMAVTAEGDVYVTGSAPTPASGLNYLTVKYTSDPADPATLTYQWATGYDGPAGGDDVPADIDVERDVLAVTGTSAGIGTGNDYATLRLCPGDGQIMWWARYAGAGSDRAVAVEARSVDIPESIPDPPQCPPPYTAGSIYVTGTSYSGSTLDDYLTIHYDAETGTGHPTWPNVGEGVGVRRYNNASMDSYETAAALVVIGSGQCFVTGRSVNCQGQGEGFAPLVPLTTDILTIAYDSVGALQWDEYYDSNGTCVGNDWASDIRWEKLTTVGGHVWVSGYSTRLNGTYTNDFTALQYNASTGVRRWAKHLDGAAHGDDRAAALELDPQNPLMASCYLTGRIHNSGGNWDYGTVSFDVDGLFIWSALYPGPGGGNDLAADVTSIWDPLSPLADVFITGGSLGSGSGDDAATVKYRQNP